MIRLRADRHGIIQIYKLQFVNQCLAIVTSTWFFTPPLGGLAPYNSKGPPRKNLWGLGPPSIFQGGPLLTLESTNFQKITSTVNSKIIHLQQAFTLLLHFPRIIWLNNHVQKWWLCISQIYHFMYWREKNVSTYEKFAHPWIYRVVVGFSEFRGEDFTRGKGKIPGVETPVGAMHWDI